MAGKIYNRDVRLSKGAKLYQGDSAMSHFVVAAGTATTAGGDATETITVSGITTSDTVMVMLKTEGSTPVTVDRAAITAANTITVTMSADPSTDHVLQYFVYRANA